jgi:protease-4
MSKEALDSIAQGRVWAGSDALKIGLADSIGGIGDAVEIAANLANLEDYSIDEYPRSKDPIERVFEEILKQAKARSMEFLLGKEGYEARLLLEALANYDYRQALAPSPLIPTP